MTSSLLFFFVKYESVGAIWRRRRRSVKVWISGLDPGSSACLRTWFCPDFKQNKHILRCASAHCGSSKEIPQLAAENIFGRRTIFWNSEENKFAVQTKQSVALSVWIHSIRFEKMPSFTDPAWFSAAFWANNANLTIRRPRDATWSSDVYFYAFIETRVPLVHLSTAALAIICGFCVLSGTGRLFQPPVYELTTAYENRWRAQSSAYLFYQAEINAANTGQWVIAAFIMHVLCSLCSTASQTVSVRTQINECVECELTSLDIL